MNENEIVVNHERTSSNENLNEEHWAGLLESGVDRSGSEFSRQIVHAKTRADCVILSTSCHKMSVVSWCWIRHRSVAACEEMTQI